MFTESVEWRESDANEEERRGDQEVETEGACPECGGHGVLTAEGDEHVCEECGLVLEESRVDHGPEWRAYDQSEREARSRVGAPTTETMHDRGLTTDIGWRDEDASGQRIPAAKRERLNRLRTWHERIRTGRAGERNLRFALSEIDRMSSALGLPKSVRETASVVYRRALSQDLIRGRSIEAVASGSLYAACRQEGLPRSLDEVADVSRVEKRDIGRTYRHVAAELDLNLAPVDPAEYLPRFCSELDLSEEVRRRAAEILSVASEEGLCSGRSPTGTAAAAIYTAAMLYGERRTQCEVADVAQVTVVTIRNRYHEQLEALDVGSENFA